MMENIDLFVSNDSDLQVEYAMIGWVFADNRHMADMSRIRAEDFHSTQHSDAWQAMEQLFRKGHSVTPFTVAPLLKRADSFAENGGPIKYLAGSLAETLVYPFPKELENHLIRLSQQRQLTVTCKEAMKGTSPMEAAAMLSRMAEKIMNAAPTEEFEDNQQVTQQIITAMGDVRKPSSTGLPRLDNAMDGGLYPGKSYGIAARKKHGKTTLGGTISHNLNLAGIKHLFICGEMSPVEIQQRTIARATDSFSSAFRSDFGKSNAFIKKIEAYAKDTPCNVLFKNSPGLTFDELRRVYAAAVDHHQVKGVILDYWQLVGGKGKSQSTAEHLDEVAQWIADYSRKRGIWSLVMAQINQEGNTRGGEGMRLAFDQVYNLQAPGDDPSRSDRWLEMMETRYTGWKSIGSENSPAYLLNEKGPYFEEMKA